MTSIFSGLITSKTRIKILMRLFLNPKEKSYLRELSNEFGIAPSQVKEELLHLTESGLLESKKNGRQIFYNANCKHPLYIELHSMVKKALGMDRIIESIIQRLGYLDKVFLIDDYAIGKDTGLIDLILVGDIDQGNLCDLVAKTEKYIGRKIRTLVLANNELDIFFPTLKKRPTLLLWESKEPESVRHVTPSRAREGFF